MSLSDEVRAVLLDAVEVPGVDAVDEPHDAGVLLLTVAHDVATVDVAEAQAPQGRPDVAVEEDGDVLVHVSSSSRTRNP